MLRLVGNITCSDLDVILVASENRDIIGMEQGRMVRLLCKYFAECRVVLLVWFQDVMHGPMGVLGEVLNEGIVFGRYSRKSDGNRD